MKKRYWFFVLGLPFIASSCNNIRNVYDKIFGDFVVQKYPDTLVLSIDPESTEVQYLVNDSMYSIIRYWMNGQDRMFKSLEEHYKRGRLHGDRFEWNRYGVMTHSSHWDEGIKVGIAKEIFPNDTVNQLVQYADNGNRQFEWNFHANGRRKTSFVGEIRDSLDTTLVIREESPAIMYYNGKLNGMVSYFDSLGNATETYVYKNDILLGVRLFKKQYMALEANARTLAAQMRQDSMEELLYKRDQHAKDSLDSIYRVNNPTPNVDDWDNF